MIKLDELRKKSQAELQQTLEDLAKERFSLRIKRGSGLNPKPNLFRENKKIGFNIKNKLLVKKFFFKNQCQLQRPIFYNGKNL